MNDPLSLLPEGHEKEFDSRYRIVLVAAQRAKQLMQGSSRNANSKFIKETSLALEETLQNQVSFLIGNDARQALKDSKYSGEQEIDPALLAEVNEDSQEIKKELSVYIDDSPKEPEPEESV